MTGKKATDKIYYNHTGYVGHLKEKRLEQQMAKDPRCVLRHAVRKMLPRNFLTQKRINLILVDSAGPKNAASACAMAKRDERNNTPKKEKRKPRRAATPPLRQCIMPGA